MVPFSFAGETFVASTDGALHWPAQKALLVADLHLEKASWFARLGQFLPPYDSVATLTALNEVVQATGATRLYCLGDSFHDRRGPSRLNADDRASILALQRGRDWIWIAGNHDFVCQEPSWGPTGRGRGGWGSAPAAERFDVVIDREKTSR